MPGGPLERDTCRDYVLPLLRAAGWGKDEILEQFPITDGRIVPVGRKHRRAKPLRADYVLEYVPGVPIAVVEAKRAYSIPGKGLQQAKRYAQLLDLPFAYSTNGKGIVGDDRDTGIETPNLSAFPSPESLWSRYRAWKGIVDDSVAEGLLLPFNRALRNARARRVSRLRLRGGPLSLSRPGKGPIALGEPDRPPRGTGRARSPWDRCRRAHGKHRSRRGGSHRCARAPRLEPAAGLAADRARRVRKDHAAFFESHQPGAREVLGLLLDKYAEHGISQLDDPGVLQVPPLSSLGSPVDIAGRFGSNDALKKAVERLAQLLYVA